MSEQTSTKQSVTFVRGGIISGAISNCTAMHVNYMLITHRRREWLYKLLPKGGGGRKAEVVRVHLSRDDGGIGGPICGLL